MIKPNYSVYNMDKVLKVKEDTKMNILVNFSEGFLSLEENINDSIITLSDNLKTLFREGRDEIISEVGRENRMVGEALNKIAKGFDAVSNSVDAMFPDTRSSIKRFDEGDHLYVRRLIPPYTHHGIYCGNNRVIHYADGIVQSCTLEEFSQGNDVYIKYSASKYSNSEIVSRAISRVGERKYHVLFENCEHLCNWCRNGDYNKD